MDLSPKELRLCPGLSRLTWETRDLIRYGSRSGHLSRSEVGTAVCTEMFAAGYGLDEAWVIMTDPANGISAEFFEKAVERAEAYLEQIISEAYEAEANRRKGCNG